MAHPLDGIKQHVLQHLPVADALKSLQKGSSVKMEGFTGSAATVLIDALSGHFDAVLLLTQDDEVSVQMVSDLRQLGNDSALFFPSTRARPYDVSFVPDLSVMVQRSELLASLHHTQKPVLVSSLSAFAEKMVSKKEFQDRSFTIRQNQTLALEELKIQLADIGFVPDHFVRQPGEYAVRGGILDIFPFAGEYPVRLEFFGDTIDSIREFDPDSQRSISFLNETTLVPNAAFDTHSDRVHLLSYLPANTLIVLHKAGEWDVSYRTFWETTIAEYQTLAKEQSDLPFPEMYYTSYEEWTKIRERVPLLQGGSLSSPYEASMSLTLRTSPHPSFQGSAKLLSGFIQEQSKKGGEVVILSEHQNQSDRLEELLGDASEAFNYRILVQNLHGGFLLHDANLSVLTDHEIFGRYHRPVVRRKRVSGGLSLKELKDLQTGDFVVHVDHGIARFRGFKKIKVRDHIQEAAVLEYREQSILYVNVSSLHKLQKYSGKEGTQPTVTKLGSGEWARKKAAAKKKVKDIARDLIRLYAKRKAETAFSFPPDHPWQTELEARFEYEETKDQFEAIRKVKEDMESPNPMDRLVCGDVGFGKTEVAVRAAFKAVMGQKQVAVLVPTTILADQHAKTFRRRMESFPVVIESLSRFRTAAEQKQVLSDLKEGKVDIVIGTHRLVSKDVQFKDLGLLIIDEEQRFGVSVKEKLKQMRSTVDVLTMTATPIPRTLQFSLMGARDLSVIQTPPANRQPVLTEIHTFNQKIIRDAILFELSRGGQIFFIHNRVSQIEEMAAMLSSLVPNVRVRWAHGQMASAELENIISDFYLHKFDLLVSTNIVENGIDISNANTIMIHHADRFGLSELHQLRGRVGRSMRKAFCYLLTRDWNTLSSDSKKRLTSLEEYSELGSGFSIAMRDLDIRGAGDILGAEQSGFVADIGFTLYTKILDDAVNELKENEFSDIFTSYKPTIELPETSVEFDLDAYIDQNYVEDSVERVNLYRRLAEATSLEDLDEWVKEMKDRFGPVPESVLNLVDGARIKWLSSRLLLKKVTIRSDRMWLLFPQPDQPSAGQMYESGYFVSLIRELGEQKKHSIKLVQKEGATRVVLHSISDLGDAIEFLKSCTPYEVFTMEPVT